MNNKVFIIDGNWYMLYRDKGETLERFIDRGNFICKSKPQTKVELDKLTNISRIWVNMKYNKCKYGKDIESEVLKHDSSLSIRV